MPQTQMQHEDQWKLPEDEPMRAELLSVKEETIKFVYKQGDRAGKAGEFTKWVWEFTITEGDYAGLHAWGETEPKLTNHPDNKVRQWGEAMLDTKFELGQGLNTDDLLSLPCVIICAHEETKKSNGDPFYKCPVRDVLPATAMDGLESAQPPF